MKALICLLLVLTLLPAHAAALDLSGLRDALPPETGVSLSPEDIDVKDGARSLLARLTELLRQQLRSALAEGGSILAVGALAGLAGAVSPITASEVGKKSVGAAAVCAAAAVCLGSSAGVLSGCARSLEHLQYFSAALIPVYAAAVASSGNPLAAVATSSATLLFSNALIVLASRLMIPLLHAHIVMLAAAQIADSSLIRGAASLFRRGALAFFKAFLMLYTSYVSISGLIAAGSDAMAVKTAKATLAGSVPVLGSVISDVSEAILSGAVVLRHSLGVFGFLGAAAICLAPFAAAWVRMIVFRLTSLFASALGGGGLSGLLDGAADGYRVALGLLGTCCAIEFLSLVVCSAVVRV